MATTTTTSENRAVWLLGVDHSNHTEFHNVVAVFESAEKGIEYLESFGLGDIERCGNSTYVLRFSMDEAIKKELFGGYYTQWGDDIYDLILVKRVLNEQFKFDHNE